MSKHPTSPEPNETPHTEVSSTGPFRKAAHSPTIKLDDSVVGDPGLTQLTNASDRYVGKGELGKGGMATIRAVEDPNLGRQVALKAIHPHLSKQKRPRGWFVREARIMAQLEHPNIVPVHELGMKEDGALYFTMKRVEGVTLRHVLGEIQRGRKKYVDAYPRSRLLDILIDVCHAMAFAHSRRVMHRDLKPENILVGSYGEVLVMDWGLARCVDDAADEEEADPDGVRPLLEGMDPELTMAGSISGSPHFMSPEQARGASDMDLRSDIYSLGAMLYEMLTGQFPANGIRVEDVLRSVLHDEVVSPGKRAPKQRIPRELDAICMKALAKKPGDRYPDLESMHKDLVRFRDGRPVSVHRDSLPRRMWKACLRHPIISASLLAAMVASVTSFGTFLYAREQRLQGFLESAEMHRTEGDRVYDEKLLRTKELLALRSGREEGLPGIGEEALAETVAHLHSRSENEHQLAIMFFSTINRMRVEADPVVQNAQRDILRRKIEYACLVEDFQDAQKWLDLVALAFQGSSDSMPEELENEIEELQRFIREARERAGRESFGPNAPGITE